MDYTVKSSTLTSVYSGDRSKGGSPQKCIYGSSLIEIAFKWWHILEMIKLMWVQIKCWLSLTYGSQIFWLIINGGHAVLLTISNSMWIASPLGRWNRSFHSLDASWSRDRCCGCAHESHRSIRWRQGLFSSHTPALRWNSLWCTRCGAFGLWDASDNLPDHPEFGGYTCMSFCTVVVGIDFVPNFSLVNWLLTFGLCIRTAP